jgi:hypothetical protein
MTSGAPTDSDIFFDPERIVLSAQAEGLGKDSHFVSAL